MIKVVAQLNPFEKDFVTCDVPFGATVTEIVGSKCERIHVEVNGIPIPLEAWDSTFPDDEALVTIVVAPQGIIEGIIAAVMGAVTSATAAGATAGLVVAGSVGLTGTAATTAAAVIGGTIGGLAAIGSMLMPMLMPLLVRPQIPTGGSGYSGSQASGRYSMLTAQSNPTMQYGVVPKLYGKFRITPVVVGQTYTTVYNVNTGQEATQIMHVLLLLGYGPMKVGSYIIGPADGRGYSLEGTERVDIIGKNYPSRTNYGGDTILIGNTPINVIDNATFTIGNAQAVLTNVVTGTATYNKDVEEENLGISMPYNQALTNKETGGTVLDGSDWIRSSAENPDRITIDIAFNSLYSIHMKSDKSGMEDKPVTVLFSIQYRRSAFNGAAATQWVPYNLSGGQFPVPGLIKKPVVYSAPIQISTGTFTNPDGTIVRHDIFTDSYGGGPVPVGQKYDVRVVRVHTVLLPRVEQTFADATWTTIRSFLSNKVENIWDLDPDTGVPDAILMAVQVAASSQLNGSLDAITVMAEAVLRRPQADTVAGFNADPTFHWAATRSPAWAYADVFTGTQLNQPLRKDKIDWPALIRWANWCDGTTNTQPDGTRKITTYDWYHMEGETMLDRIRSIVSCGRATWAISNATFSAIQDTKFEPVQMFTARNSRGFEFVRSYPKIAHALRVRYVHPRTWQQAEKIVLDDYFCIRVNGAWYDAWNKVVKTEGGAWSEWVPAEDRPKYALARLYETLETQGVTGGLQAFREGRYHIANLRLRRETYTIEVDFENLVAQRGDCVYLSSDVLLRGRNTGRIIEIRTAEGAGGHPILALDEEIEITNELDDAGAPMVFALQVRCFNDSTLGPGPQGMEFVTIPLSNPPGKTREAFLSSGFADLAKLSVGDLWVFGPINTQTILAKIVQIDYQPDMSARLTMVSAAPGVATADDGLIDEDDTGPEIPPELKAPPIPVFQSLGPSGDPPKVTRDGFVFSADAIWSVPSSTNDGPTTHIEIAYQVGDQMWSNATVEPSPPSFRIKDVPALTQINAKLRGWNKKNGIQKASEWTDTKIYITPSEDEFAPKMPINLDLVQFDYREANGRVLFFIQATWTIVGYTGGTHIEWIKLSDIPDDDVWPDDKKQSSFVEGTGQFYEIKGIEVTTYVVRIRSKSLVLNDLYSAWNEGEIEIQVYDYPPGPPTNLQAKSTPSGIMLTWDNPLDSDFAGIQIYENIANTRDGLFNEVPPVPEAKQLTKVTNPGNSFFHVPDDRVWHYYWIRSYDTEDGITPSQTSSWEKLGDNEGVRGRQGTFGDGLPPPPPINLVLTPDTWEIGLHWEQSQEIPDLFGTQIFFSETNDRGPDEALLATYLATSQNNYGTHTRLETGKTYYYWIRNIDMEDLVSTWLPEDRYGGATATVPPDPWKYLQLLNGAITETQLAQSLLGLINSQGLETNQTFLALETLVTQLAARVVLKIQQNYGGLSEVSAIGFGSEVQNEQIISQFLVQTDRFAVGAPQVFNSAGVELSPIQYDENGDLPTVYDIAGNTITPYGYDGQLLPAHLNHPGLVRHVYDASGNRMPIYTEDHKVFPTPRWDTFVITTEEYIDAEGNFIPPGAYIRDANIATGSINGRKIKAGTITADLIDTRGLVIRDASGNEIFGANVELNLEKMFGPDMAKAINDLIDKDIHLYIKNGVIGNLYIADELSSVDYSASYYTEANEYVAGTGWRVHRGTISTESVIGSPSIIETDNLEARGTLSSDIYIPGVLGWKVFKEGSCEFNNGVFRGTLGAETLLIGTDFNLGQLSEQVLLASLNIQPSGQFFKYSAGGNPYGDVNLAFHVNVLDNVTWSATARPSGVALTLTTDETKPRYRFLSNAGMVEGVEYIEVRATYQDRYDVVKIYKLQDDSGVVKAFATNARINLAADSRGNVSNFSRATGRVRVFNGTDEVAKSTVTYSIIGAVGCSATIVNDPTKVDHGTYKLTGNTEANGSITVRATYNGVNYDEVVGFSVYQAILSGTPGDPGKDGERGTKYFVFFSTGLNGFTEATWTQTQPASNPNNVLPPSTELAELYIDQRVKQSEGSNQEVVLRDVVTLINYDTGYQQTRMRTQTGWLELAAYIAGNMLVDGTIYARHIVASGITLSAGSNSQESKTVSIGVETGENYLEPVALAMKDAFESVHLFFAGAIQVESGGVNTQVTIFFRKSIDGGATWETLGSQTYGVPGNPIPIKLPYSYNLVVENQAYVADLRYKVVLKVPGGSDSAVVSYDRSFSVLGTYR